MLNKKQTTPVTGYCNASKHPVSGYEIHMGKTQGTDCQRPLFRLNGVDDGATNHDGTVQGTYLHGVFNNDAFRAHWLNSIRPGLSSDLRYEQFVDDTLDALADEMESELDIEALLASSMMPS